MKTTLISTSQKVGWMAVIIAVASACQNDNANVKPTPQQISHSAAEATAAENTQIIGTAVDVFDITSVALNQKGAANGRVESGARQNASDGLCNATVGGDFSIETRNDSTFYSGTITIDYGSGTYCGDSAEYHKGKITDRFVLATTLNDAKWYSLSQSVTFTGFQKDSVLVDGLFVSTSLPGSNSINIQNAKITYQDGTSSTLNGELDCLLTSSKNGMDGSRQVTGSLNGTTRGGLIYTAVIAAPVYYDFSCSTSIPADGTIVLTIEGISSTLEYGGGECDAKYTVTTGDDISHLAFAH